jgi:hypothetical protein
MAAPVLEIDLKQLPETLQNAFAAGLTPLISDRSGMSQRLHGVPYVTMIRV